MSNFSILSTSFNIFRRYKFILKDRGPLSPGVDIWYFSLMDLYYSVSIYVMNKYLPRIFGDIMLKFRFGVLMLFKN